MDTRPVRILSLFAGIGGLDLGVCTALRRLGFAPRVVCAVEGEAYACALLAAKAKDDAKLGGDFPIWSDITTFKARRWRGSVDLVIGGWPCTNTSSAGDRTGLGGSKSSLFFEYARILRELGCPQFFMENVAGVYVGDTLSRVCGALASLGYGLEYASLRASSVGASHRRERWFCLGMADPDSQGCGELSSKNGSGGGQEEPRENARWRDDDRCRATLGDTDEPRLEGSERTIRGGADKSSSGERGSEMGRLPRYPPGPDERAEWRAVLEVEPNLAPALERDVCGLVDGTSRTDALRALGNSCVPDQACAAFLALSKRYLE